MTFENIFGDKFSKFRLGQLIFITAVTFGLFAGDVIRIVLGVLSLFFLTRENFKFPKWTRVQKITLTLLALFCAWMIIIPVIFGENPLNVRLRDAVRPLELTIWICITFLFAKDEFFVRNLKNFSITACFCYAVIALEYCYKVKFIINYDEWPIIMRSFTLGVLVTGTSVWVLYTIAESKNIFGIFFSLMTLLLALLLTALSRYTTYWCTMALQIFVALFLLLIINRKYFLKLFLSLSCIVAIIFSGLYYVSMHNPQLHDALIQEIDQISIHKGQNFDVDHFTNHRFGIWTNAIECVKLKPFFGYGDEVFSRYAKPLPNGQLPPHIHNTFLQIAFEAGIPLSIIAYLLWGMIFFLAVYKTYKTKQIYPLTFAVIVLMSGFILSGLVENLYHNNRAVFLFYWPIFVTMIATYAKIPKTTKNNT